MKHKKRFCSYCGDKIVSDVFLEGRLNGKDLVFCKFECQDKYIEENKDE